MARAVGVLISKVKGGARCIGDSAQICMLTICSEIKVVISDSCISGVSLRLC